MWIFKSRINYLKKKGIKKIKDIEFWTTILNKASQVVCPNRHFRRGLTLAGVQTHHGIRPGVVQNPSRSPFNGPGEKAQLEYILTSYGV